MATGPWDELAEQIAEVIESVENCGVVHARERYVKTWPQLLDNFKWTHPTTSDKQIRGWQIVPGAMVVDTSIEGLGGDFMVSDGLRFEIRGIQSVNDEQNSHDEFLRVAMDVKLALDLKQDFEVTTVSGVEVVVPDITTWVSWGLRMFGNVACWSPVLQRTITIHRHISSA
jgi:hypothetical protein